MSVKMRQEIERKIATAIIESALAAGFSLGVNNGEEITLDNSTDKVKILAALFTTDDDYLLVRRRTGLQPAGAFTAFGWVRLIYGNDGHDVVNDYTTNLESIMTEANKLADHYGS
jgi:hypothetical protein